MENSSTLVLSIALMIIMFRMGITLTVDDFKRVLKYPKAVFIGLLNQVILLPIIGYLLIGLLGVNANIAMGVMILSACPGGPTSNLLTHLAKGDTALSVTLTAVNSVITIFTIPLIVNFGLSEFFDGSSIEAPIGQIGMGLAKIIALPLVLGMLLKKFKDGLAQKMDKPLNIASIALLVIIIVGLVVKKKTEIADNFADTILIILALNLGTMLIGFFSALAAKLSFREAITISIESGNQNGTLAIFIGVSMLEQPSFVIVGGIYSLVMYITSILPITIGIRNSKKDTV